MENGRLYYCNDCKHFLNDSCAINAAPCDIDFTTDASKCTQEGVFKERTK